MSCCGGNGHGHGHGHGESKSDGGACGSGGCGSGGGSSGDDTPTLQYLGSGQATDASKVVDGKCASPPSGMTYRLHVYPP